MLLPNTLPRGGRSPYGVKVATGRVESVGVSLTPDETYDAAVTAALPGLTAGLAALYAAFIPLHALLLDGTARLAMVACAATSALALGAFALALRHRRLPDHLSQPATAGLMLVAIGNAVAHLVLTEQPRQTSTVMLVVVASGAVLLSLRWLAATLYLAWGAWGVGAFLVGPREQWPHYVIGMACATLLAVFVNHLRRASVRELADLRAAAEAAAVRDHLTGVANRRGLAMVGSQMVEQARRQGDAVHCIFVDIDGLKRVNDALGHAIGDEVIVAVAEALRSATRAPTSWPGGAATSSASSAPDPAWPRSSWSGGCATAWCSPRSVPAEVWPVRVSAGGAMLAPWDSGTLETLLGKADQEMYLRRSLRKEAGTLPHRRAAAESPPASDSSS